MGLVTEDAYVYNQDTIKSIPQMQTEQGLSNE